MKIGVALASLVLCGLCGCGASPNGNCNLVPSLSVLPATATANSAAKAPGNQTQFIAAIGEKPASPGYMCSVPALEHIAYPAWTNPDPIHISISSAQDATNGTAICKGPTGGPVQLTATVASSTAQPLTATVQLTCE